MLDFVGIPPSEERSRRLKCANALSDHPLVHRPPSNFTLAKAFEAFPGHVCTLLQVVERHEQVKAMTRLLGYGNFLNLENCDLARPSRDADYKCTDMLVDQYTGAPGCKIKLKIEQKTTKRGK